MLPPPRCFTCNKVLEHRKVQCALKAGGSMKEALAETRRACCRRMLLCYPAGLADIVMASTSGDVVSAEFNYEIVTRPRADRTVETV